MSNFSLFLLYFGIIAVTLLITLIFQFLFKLMGIEKSKFQNFFFKIISYLFFIGQGLGTISLYTLIPINPRWLAYVLMAITFTIAFGIFSSIFEAITGIKPYRF